MAKLRNIRIGKRGKVASGLSVLGASEAGAGNEFSSFLAKRATLEELHVRPQLVDRDLFPHRLSGHIRSPWLISSKLWLRRGRSIPLFINPAETSWSMPRRETFVKTKAGLVRNVWRNRYRRSYYDEFTINITFQAGNLMPGSPYVPSESGDSRLANPSLPTGLENFYEFLEMLDQPALIGTEENRHIIHYRSRVFPQMKLEGYFVNEPMNFTDSAANGNTIQWTHTFRVYRTTPRINSFEDMSRVYYSWVRERANMEVLSETEQTLDRLARQRDIPETLVTLPRNPPDPPPTTAEIFAGPPVI